MRIEVIHYGLDYAKLIVGLQEFEVSISLAKALEEELKNEN